jgi:phosphomannomutase
MLIKDLMTESGVGFGTSGARGLACAMTDRVCYAYSLAFAQHLYDRRLVSAGTPVGLAGDLRPSTERILTACARALLAGGLRPLNLGRIPTPALAAFGIARGIPTMMVTGSHIPDDRNGVKFNLPSGEILKEDEEGIRGQWVALPQGLFHADGGFAMSDPSALPPVDDSARAAYLSRYLGFFPAGCLSGLRVGLYEHSTVAREALYEVLRALGAEVERLGFAERFVPVDTEAIRPEDVALAREWCADGRFDALVSADGDGDRPLVADERGEWLRGDILGILCARELGARGVVTPVSSNTAVDRCGLFDAVRRTRIGSPFVIAGMQELVEQGLAPVIGYEANGGFLIASDIGQGGRRLPALPTRDAVIVTVSVLRASRDWHGPVSQFAAELPRRFTDSDRIKDFPTALSQARLGRLMTADPTRDKAAVEAILGEHFGTVVGIDTTDGLRVSFASGEIVHLRPSGNAPELRAYTEANTPERAHEMGRICMRILDGWRDEPTWT